MNVEAFEETLRPLGGLRRAEPLSRHTTFGVGGPADWFLVVHDRATLIAAVRAARQFGVPYLLISGGSNMLASDAGFRGLVIDNRTRQIEVLEDDPTSGKRRLEADAGVNLATLAHRATRLGVAGLEWAAGIPGTVGGGVLFNAGAHGHSLSEVLEAAQVLDADLEVRWLRACQIDLGYRASSLSREAPPGGGRRLVCAARFLLHPDDPSAIRTRVLHFNAQRRATQPSQASAGSVFKNPPGTFAGALVEQAGLKGAHCGGAQISERHANFIVNTGGATASDVMALVHLAQRRVHEQYGVDLELEVELVGEWGS